MTNPFVRHIFFVIKKYAINMLLHSSLLYFVYVFIKYSIDNNYTWSFKEVVFLAFPIYLPLALINLFLKPPLKTAEKTTVLKPIGKATQISIDSDNKRTLKLRAYHEAGHFLVAETLGFSVKAVNILSKGNSGGEVILNLPSTLTTSEMEKIIKVKYAGFASEKIFIGEPSSGSMGSENADFESANRLLRNYVILTDSDLSFTGYEKNQIESRSIELSKKWMKEVENMLRVNEDKIKIYANILIESQVLTNELIDSKLEAEEGESND